VTFTVTPGRPKYITYVPTLRGTCPGAEGESANALFRAAHVCSGSFTSFQAFAFLRHADDKPNFAERETIGPNPIEILDFHVCCTYAL